MRLSYFCLEFRLLLRRRIDVNCNASAAAKTTPSAGYVISFIRPIVRLSSVAHLQMFEHLSVARIAHLILPLDPETSDSISAF